MPTNRPIWSPLRGYGAFARVLARGKVFSSGSVRCFVRLHGKGGLSIGFGVSRSVRTAVVRNKIRRLLRESVRLHQQRIVGQGTRGIYSAEIVLMYTGGEPPGRSSVHLNDMDDSVAQLLASVSEYCEAGNCRAGRSAD